MEAKPFMMASTCRGPAGAAAAGREGGCRMLRCVGSEEVCTESLLDR
jgi:hypothetical protein